MSRGENSPAFRHRLLAGRAGLIIGVALAASLAVSTPYSFASSAAPSFDRVCKPILAKKSDPNIPSQKKEACLAAQANQEAIGAQGILWKVWAGVAAVCAQACVYPVLPSWSCSRAQIGGTVVDGLVTQDFAAALQNAAQTVGMNMLVSQVTGGSEEAAGTAKKPDRDWAACMSALSAGGMALSKKSSIGDAKLAFEEQVKLATQTDSDASAFGTGAVLPGGLQPGAPGGGDAPLAGRTATQPGDTSVSDSGSSSVCGDAIANPSMQGSIACAIARDPSLPSFVQTPNFAQNFEEKTGVGLDEFLAQETSSPSDMIAGAISAGFGPSSAAVAAAVHDMDRKLASRRVEGAAYAHGAGGGGGSSGGSEADPFAAMMQNFMGQLLPGQEKKESSRGVKEIAFGKMKGRSPAAIAEDRSISIFDRVTWRYQFVGRRMVTAGAKR